MDNKQYDILLEHNKILKALTNEEKTETSFTLYNTMASSVETSVKNKLLSRISVHVNVQQFVADLQTGDIIFGRSESLFGKIIQYSSECVWNHIAMCIVDEVTGEKYWCESTNNSNDGIEAGVKIWNIEEKFTKEFATNTNQWYLFGISKLKYDNPSQYRETARKMIQFYQREKGKKYKESYTTLFYAWFDGFSKLKHRFCCTTTNYQNKFEEYKHDKYNQPNWAVNPINTKSYFCSEFLAECLTEVGLLKKMYTKNGLEIGSGEWEVASFANTDFLNENLQNNFYYTNVVFVVLVS